MAPGFARALVRAFALVLSLQFGLVASSVDPLAHAAGVGTTESRAIQAAVQRQFDAFDRDDAAAAFAQASRAARERFGTPERFMEMVKAQYQAVYRRRSVIFTDIERVDGLTIQSVRVTDADDRVWVALYQMQQEADGQWRILGCQLLETKSVST